MGFFNSSRQSFLKESQRIFNQQLRSSSPPSPDEFYDQTTDVIIKNLLLDVLEYAVAQDQTPVPIFPNFNGQVLGDTLNAQQAFSLYDVCFYALKNGVVRYSYLSHTNKGFLFDQKPDDSYALYEASSPYSTKDHHYALKKIIAYPLRLLYSLYSSLTQKEQLFKNKVIVGINGLRGGFNQGLSSALDLEAFEKTLGVVKSQVESILDSRNNVWIFDANDTITSPSYVDENIALSQDFIYQEISRILGIPKTRLLGDSPKGLNATGEHDMINYHKTLNALFQGLVYPILKVADPYFKPKSTLKVQDVQQVAQVLDLIAKSPASLYSDRELSTLKQELYLSIGLDLSDSVKRDTVSDDTPSGDSSRGGSPRGDRPIGDRL